ncbi:hypothetical protein QTP70_023838 [Hemibagrus guttatus]|uniref:Interferon-induced protein 44-like n=1 Tax=Hemibagrus guttatus TaxID=175788 RepID=A0AAE0QGM0_9TELE|nr:hypothetical protein QTP70_023838 [Hemibagrus guttatus]
MAPGCSLGRRQAGRGSTMYTLSWKRYSLMAVVSSSRIMGRATKQKWFRNGLMSTAMSLVLTWPPNSPDLNTIDHLWDVLDKQIRSMEVPPRNLQDLKDLLLTSWCQIPEHTFRDLVESMPRRVKNKGKYLATLTASCNFFYSSNSELKESLRNFTLSNPNIRHLRILLHGPVGAGKSTFINSLSSVFQQRITAKVKAASSASTSCTKTYKGYEIKCLPTGTLPVTIFDFMGLEDTAQNVHPDDFKNALRGHLPDGYKFNHEKPLSSNDPRYIRNPSVGEKTHCLVCVVSANSISRMSNATIDQMKLVLEEASELGIPGAVIMTMSDLVCPAVTYDLKYVYTSKTIKTKMEECSNKLQIPMTCIFPVKNYHDEIKTNDDTDILLLLALKQIAHFANDYVEDLGPQERS